MRALPVLLGVAGHRGDLVRYPHAVDVRECEVLCPPMGRRGANRGPLAVAADPAVDRAPSLGLHAETARVAEPPFRQLGHASAALEVSGGGQSRMCTCGNAGNWGRSPRRWASLYHTAKSLSHPRETGRGAGVFEAGEAGIGVALSGVVHKTSESQQLDGGGMPCHRILEFRIGKSEAADLCVRRLSGDAVQDAEQRPRASAEIIIAEHEELRQPLVQGRIQRDVVNIKVGRCIGRRCCGRLRFWRLGRSAIHRRIKRDAGRWKPTRLRTLRLGRGVADATHKAPQRLFGRRPGRRRGGVARRR
mmetsp:Transcript_112154/g.322402  ORF Transcript_112154/g.322402 Transcript_112154/m.322402 type:complete len:304 (-) Transcript_112154:176-1087(-)